MKVMEVGLIIVISLAFVIGFFAIVSTLTNTQPFVSGTTTQAGDIKVYSGQSVEAGGYGAHYDGNSRFFVYAGNGWNWEVEIYYKQPFKLGTIWYSVVSFDGAGVITIREVSPP